MDIKHEDILEYRKAVQKNPLKMELIMDALLQQRGRQLNASFYLDRFSLNQTSTTLPLKK